MAGNKLFLDSWSFYFSTIFFEREKKSVGQFLVVIAKYSEDLIRSNHALNFDFNWIIVINSFYRINIDKGQDEAKSELKIARKMILNWHRGTLTTSRRRKFFSVETEFFTLFFPQPRPPHKRRNWSREKKNHTTTKNLSYHQSPVIEKKRGSERERVKEERKMVLVGKTIFPSHSKVERFSVERTWAFTRHETKNSRTEESAGQRRKFHHVKRG